MGIGDVCVCLYDSKSNRDSFTRITWLLCDIEKKQQKMPNKMLKFQPKSKPSPRVLLLSTEAKLSVQTDNHIRQTTFNLSLSLK